MIKTRIWEIRTEQGITLTKLSKLTGISKSALNYFENGKRSPRITQLESIAKALNVHFIDTLYSYNEQISTYVEIVSKGISNTSGMLYNSSIKRLNEEELKLMDRETTKKYIIEMVERINDNDALLRIFNYIYTFFLK